MTFSHRIYSIKLNLGFIKDSFNHRIILEFFLLSSTYIILILIVLISVPFITLLEQKILSFIQIRVGPNYIGYSGLLQPFADAVKLFFKETITLRLSTLSVFHINPIIILSLSLFIWVILPIKFSYFTFPFSILFFICLRSLIVYPILSIGWSSNSKYAILGSIRSTAQIISYEVRLIIILLRLALTNQTLNINFINSQNYFYNLLIFIPLGYIWLASTLAETNRSPYDFSEGESELVSGFNTEYSAEGFTLIFISEYTSILFIRSLFSALFLSFKLDFFFSLKIIFITSLIIWIRAVIPRYRYDKLIRLAWKKFLPISILLFILYFYLNIL